MNVVTLLQPPRIVFGNDCVLRDAIPQMARAAIEVTRLLKNNLRPPTQHNAVRIYETAY